MYVCMYACMYVWMHVCMHVCMYACMYVCLYVCMMYVCMFACMYVCMHACMYVCLHVCMYVCMHACMYVFVNLHSGIKLHKIAVALHVISSRWYKLRQDLMEVMQECGLGNTANDKTWRKKWKCYKVPLLIIN